MSFLVVEPKVPARPEKGMLLSRGLTPLSKGLQEHQEAWLLEYVTDRWLALHNALTDWRGRMQRWERMADDDYSDRAAAPDRDKTDAPMSIFARQNHTLGLVSGKCDQVYAQAKDDIFGTRPWLAATPQGKDDTELADVVTKHSQYKFDQSNLEPVLIDAIALAAHLGTALPKIRWDKTIEEYEKAEFAAHFKGKALTDEAGAYILDDEALAAYLTKNPKVPGEKVTWEEILITETDEVYNNVDASCLDWKDVAFDPLAPELDLRHTDFLHRFKMGIHDLAAQYGLTAEQKDDLLAAAQLGGEQEPREHRGEVQSNFAASMRLDSEANPVVWLVEGYLRCDPFGTGKPIRVHVIFSPSLHVLFRCNYLINETPGGILPVFPVRAFKVPRRILGKGYWERFQDANDAADGLYNATTVRNRTQADVFKGVQLSALADESEGKNLVNHPEKLWELRDDKTIDDLFQFKAMPDLAGRSDQLLQQILQMTNQRMGSSSASQGELTGIPENDTATGSKINAGRSAILDKAQITQVMKDLRAPVEFAVHLVYANHDHDETFTWGEGRDAVLMTIKAGDVQGLRANVSLTLTQSQNLQKVEAGKQAIEVAQAFGSLLPEHQMAFRPLFVQVISGLGFQNAEDMVPRIDPMALAMPPGAPGMPPPVAPVVPPAAP